MRLKCNGLGGITNNDVFYTFDFRWKLFCDIFTAKGVSGNTVQFVPIKFRYLFQCVVFQCLSLLYI